MARTVSIGNQDYESIREKKCFYIDKTNFIKEWWESEDAVTLIARPRRFGKTLTISMLEQFFSNRYADRGDLFEGLSIWEYPEYQKLQGTYPVISLSFANIKETSYQGTKRRIGQLISDLYSNYRILFDSEELEDTEKDYIHEVIKYQYNMPDDIATMAIHKLSNFLFRHYGKKSSFYWTNMIHLCRRLMYTVIGRKLWHLPEVCSMQLLKPILIWNVLL